MKNIILITLTLLISTITYGQEAKTQEPNQELIEKEIEKEMQQTEKEIAASTKTITNTSKNTNARTVAISKSTTYYGVEASTAGAFNTNYGYYTGKESIASAIHNTSIGSLAGRNITTGKSNSFVGRAAGYNNKTGAYNSFFGMHSGFKTEEAIYNTAMGSYSLYSNITGTRNVALGVHALRANASGNNNTSIGYAAGYKALGNGNVNVGYYAGYHNTGSNKLYIDNSSTNTPLIYGDFSTNKLGINTNDPLAALDVNGTFIVNQRNNNHSNIKIGKEDHDKMLADNSTNKTFGGGIFFRVSRHEKNKFYNSLILADNGNVGIGTTAPKAKLHISGKSGTDGLMFPDGTLQTTAATAGGKFVDGEIATDALYNDGNVGIGTGTTNLNPFTKLTINGNASIVGENNVFKARFIDGKNYKGLAFGDLFLNSKSKQNVYVGDFTNSTFKSNLFVNGKVGIGTKSNYNTAMLTVKGDIHATEIKVKINAGADFVFAPDYNLPSLASVEAFITKNKHLPTIAPAKDMENGGLELGEMNIRLLQKVEELTLYTIQQEKKLKKLAEALLKIQQHLATDNK